MLRFVFSMNKSVLRHALKRTNVREGLAQILNEKASVFDIYSVLGIPSGICRSLSSDTTTLVPLIGDSGRTDNLRV
jgi:hypothetical protein